MKFNFGFGLVFAVIGILALLFGTIRTVHCFKSRQQCDVIATDIRGRQKLVESMSLSDIERAELYQDKNSDGDVMYSMKLRLKDGSLASAGGTSSSNRGAYLEQVNAFNAYLANDAERMEIKEGAAWLVWGIGGVFVFAGIMLMIFCRKLKVKDGGR